VPQWNCPRATNNKKRGRKNLLDDNGLGIGEVGAFKEQMFNLAQMLNGIPMLKVSTSAPILPIPCYLLGFLRCFV
jgi:hypothetical protein